MAYSFNGSNQHLSVDSAVVAQAPLTFAAWVFANNITAAHTVIATASRVTGVNYFWLGLDGATAGDPVKMETAAASGVAATSSAGFSASVWTHAAGASASSSSRSAFVNGGSKGTNSSSRTPTGLNTTNIGVLSVASSFFSYANAQIADAAIWDAELTDAEITSLAKGFKPQRIRPQNLVFYAPMVRNLQDVLGGVAITNNNTATVTSHPRVY